jgi:tetratricopeptide (TPR) repeat protein
VLLPITLVLAQAAAWSSGRPAECGEPGGRATNAWERAKSPELRRYCDLVASASSKLAGTTAMAQAALDAAREADRVLPGRAAPRVLEGRALAALGQLEPALEALRAGKERDPAALDDPLALRAWARVLARAGRADEAAEAYRALLPRSSALTAAERASASIEAGLVAMARGPAGLDEAASALREGLREAQDEAPLGVLALALVLDRRGDADEARALLAERAHTDPRATLEGLRAKDVLVVAPGEGGALLAIGLEPTDPAGAREAWQKYVDQSPNGPWAAHAKARVAALGGKHAPLRRGR